MARPTYDAANEKDTNSLLHTHLVSANLLLNQLRLVNQALLVLELVFMAAHPLPRHHIPVASLHHPILYGFPHLILCSYVAWAVELHCIFDCIDGHW